MRITFFRRGFDELVFSLDVTDASGDIHPTWFENFWGFEQELTLRHQKTREVYNAMVYPVDRNLFEASFPLNLLPIGTYRLLGRLRDMHYNYLIISEFHEDVSDANVQKVELRLEPGYNITQVYTIQGRPQKEVTIGGVEIKFIPIGGKKLGLVDVTAREAGSIGIKGHASEYIVLAGRVNSVS